MLDPVVVRYVLVCRDVEKAIEYVVNNLIDSYVSSKLKCKLFDVCLIAKSVDDVRNALKCESTSINFIECLDMVVVGCG